MSRRVLEIRGLKSLRALNAFHALVLGLKMLPAYAGEQYESFYTRVQALEDEEKMSMLKEAALFVELQPEEIEVLVSYCTDKNGCPYQKENLKNLGPDELIEVIVAVCFEISKFKIDLVTEKEKKKLKTSQ